MASNKEVGMETVLEISVVCDICEEEVVSTLEVGSLWICPECFGEISSESWSPGKG